MMGMANDKWQMPNDSWHLPSAMCHLSSVICLFSHCVPRGSSRLSSKPMAFMAKNHRFKPATVGVISIALFLLLGASVLVAAPASPEKSREHWAFQKVSHPQPPPVKHRSWARNPIDAFVASELEAR